MTTKVYRGQLVYTSNGDEDELLGLRREGRERDDPDKLAEVIEADIDENGNYLGVCYYVSDAPIPAGEIVAAFLESLYGAGSAEYSVFANETTGYLWTDENINVGGHDLLEELKSHVGKYLHMEIEFAREAQR